MKSLTDDILNRAETAFKDQKYYHCIEEFVILSDLALDPLCVQEKDY